MQEPLNTADCYRILNLEPGASADQIKQGYRDLVRVWHPDRFTADPRLRGIAEKKLIVLNQAYSRLKSRTESTPAPGPSPANAAAQPYRRQEHRHWRSWCNIDRFTLASLSLKGFRRKWNSLDTWLLIRATHLCLALLGVWGLFEFYESIYQPFEEESSRVRQALHLPAVVPPPRLTGAFDISRFGSEAARHVSGALPNFGLDRSSAIQIDPNIQPARTVVLDPKKRSPSHVSSAPSNGGARRPLTGTVLSQTQESQGEGTLTIDNKTKADAVVALASASRPEAPIERVYLRAEDKLVISGIGTGVYLATLSTDPIWDRKLRLLPYNPSRVIRLGTFLFVQVQSAEGVQSDKYEIRLTPALEEQQY